MQARTYLVVASIALMSGLLGCSKDKKNNLGWIPDGGFGNANGAGTGSGNGTSGTGGHACSDGLVRASRVTPRVILVIDGSCSMSTDYPSSGQSATDCHENPNGRWAAVRRALVDPQTGVVTKLQGIVEFGIAVFGTQPMCPLPATPIDPKLDNLQAIENALPQVQPGMFTPTGPALDWVYDNMILDTTMVDNNLGPQIVILATDGEPNSCGGTGGGGSMFGGFGGGGVSTNYQPSIDAVTKGAMKGVKTYVISLAASTGMFHDHLQQLADIGGMMQGAQLFEPNSPEELSANLQLITGAAVGCDVALNGVIQGTKVCDGKVTLNGTPLKCNDPNGFVLADPRHIRLQGTACDMLMASKDALVDAQFPCGVFQVD
jgi:hypothetical protein